MPEASFLPEEYLQKKMERRTNVLCLTLFVIVIGAVVAAFYVTDKQRRDVREQQTLISAKFEEAALRLEQLEQLEARKQEMMRKARITAQLIERLPRSLILAEIINRMPPAMSLSEIDLQTKAGPVGPPPQTKLEAVRQTRNDPMADMPVDRSMIEMALVGIAPTDVQVAAFMTALSQSDLFRDLNLRYSQETSVRDQTMRRFRIDLVVTQALDPRQYEPRLVERSQLRQNPMGDEIQIGAEGLMLPTHEGPERISAAPTQ